MSKKIIISEKQGEMLLKRLIKEEITYMGDKEELVKKWLTKHFKPMEIQQKDALSLPTKGKAVSVLDAYGQLTNNLKSLEDVFYIMQAKFKKILSDKEERDKFLKDTLLKWYS